MDLKKPEVHSPSETTKAYGPAALVSKPGFPKYSPQNSSTSSTSGTWEIVRNASSQAFAQTNSYVHVTWNDGLPIVVTQ